MKRRMINHREKNLVWFLLACIMANVYLAFYLKGLNSYSFITHVFNDLSLAFQQGHFYLLAKPSYGLLHLTDPYNPDLNALYRMRDHVHDMSLYRGHLYVYFGPTSAVFLLGLHALGVQILNNDGILTVFWVLGLVFVLMMLFRFFGDRNKVTKLFMLPALELSYFLPTGLLMAGYIFTCFNLGILTCLSRAYFYETAITSAAFFFWLGMLLMLYGLTYFNQVSSYKARVFMVCSGLSFMLAFFARYSYAPSIFFAICISLFATTSYFYRSRNWVELKSNVLNLVFFAMPFVLMIALYCWYNYARFGSILETGYNYELAGIPQRYLSLTYGLFGAKYVLTNAWMYFVHPVVQNNLPWFHIDPFYNGIKNPLGFFNYDFHHKPAFAIYTPSFLHTPFWYSTENPLGLLNIYYPLVYFIFGLLGVCMMLSMCADGRVKFSGVTGALVLVSLGLFLFQMIPLLFIFTSTWRYVADFNFSLSIFIFFSAVLGLSMIKDLRDRRLTRLAVAGTSFMLLLTTLRLAFFFIEFTWR